MHMTFSYAGKEYRAALDTPLDISIPLRTGAEHVAAFSLPQFRLEPFEAGSFKGVVREGGSCNVNNVFFSPHGNGTHTECVGHISEEFISLNDCLRKFFFIARLITISPEKPGTDSVITKSQIEKAAGVELPQALIIRTLPNDASKQNRDYTGKNAPYVHEEAARWMCQSGIEHLLLDLPSADREDDNKLLAHHAFWNYPAATRRHATITELVYVPDAIKDGLYLLNLMIASFQNDASPSKPVLYRLAE